MGSSSSSNYFRGAAPDEPGCWQRIVDVVHRLLLSSSRYREARVCITGLDGAGKTSILYKLNEPTFGIDSLIPTIGFNVEQIVLDGVEFTAWDVGGRDKIRPLQRHYFKGMDALIFVVDSADQDRLDQARDEFHRTLQEKELRSIPVLVLYNKQDLPKALKAADLTETLGIPENRIFHSHQIIVAECSAMEGSGLSEGLSRLAARLAGNNVADEKQPRESLQREAIEPTYQLEFDPRQDNPTLKSFSTIKNSTECPFAKAAKLWGGAPFDSSSPPSLEAQAEANVNALISFTNDVKQGVKLDGFCLEVNDAKARSGPADVFGECVLRVLTGLSDRDPSGENIMRVSYIGHRGWRFRFNGLDFFVTSFAPFYPATSSRYTFGCKKAFLLLQPEASFARHSSLTPDTPYTNWENPKTIRDKARAAFAKAGRRYHIPSTTTYPMAEHIVKAEEDDGWHIVQWWKPGGNKRQASGGLADLIPAG